MARDRAADDRGPPARADDARHPHGGARGAARSPGATAVARCASGRSPRAPSPGPRAMDAAGTQPTVTDANLLLGYLPSGGELAGGVALDCDAAAAAVAALAETLALDVRRCAEGIVRVANAEMVRALRVVTVERGDRPAPLRAAAVRRGRAAARMRDGASSSRSRASCARGSSGVLSALGPGRSPRRGATRRARFCAAGTRSTATQLGARRGRAGRAGCARPGGASPRARSCGMRCATRASRSSCRSRRRRA